MLFLFFYFLDPLQFILSEILLLKYLHFRRKLSWGGFFSPTATYGAVAHDLESKVIERGVGRVKYLYSYHHVLENTSQRSTLFLKLIPF